MGRRVGRNPDLDQVLDIETSFAEQADHLTMTEREFHAVAAPVDPGRVEIVTD